MTAQPSKSRNDAFRIGTVRPYRRGKIWYLCYGENGRRRQPRIGPDRDLARQSASEIKRLLFLRYFAFPVSLSVEEERTQNDSEENKHV